jgi:hypothetical protein
MKNGLATQRINDGGLAARNHHGRTSDRRPQRSEGRHFARRPMQNAFVSAGVAPPCRERSDSRYDHAKLRRGHKPQTERTGRRVPRDRSNHHRR